MSTWPASLPPPFPAFMEDRGYGNRLEAVRDRRRNGLKQAILRHGVAGECVAVLFDVYSHCSRELPKRLGTTHSTALSGYFACDPSYKLMIDQSSSGEGVRRE
jgi:metal-responsive CopG/Arc/MetJ family transcriptional regulator